MSIHKRLLSAAFAAALSFSLCVSVSASQPGLGNFTYSDIYSAGQFGDVRGTEWFAQYVEDAVNYGFFQGRSGSAFSPGGLLTFGEAVTLAARLRSIYYTGAADFPASKPFYTVYADYALNNKIIESAGNYSAPATRLQFAELIFRALPPEVFTEINVIPDYCICDVMSGTAFGEAVYALYRSGILTGSDRYGTFYPYSNITRAEACAVAVRLADPGFREITVLPEQLPAEVIYERSTDAVVMIETFGVDDKSIRTGSGFFISESGYIVTNLHVIENAARAAVTLYNGSVYPVRGVHATSEKYNLAILSIDSDTGGWSYLNLGDSDLIEEGNPVYSIGSPRELINTMSEGIISTTSRIVSGETLIQFTAPISFGSGGSPLLNKLGQVIGVASSSFSYGQNLNLAVPVNRVKELKPGKLVTLESLLHK